MKHCIISLPTMAENLACDEALLDYCDSGSDELLRFWEPAQYAVVLGYANQLEQEVNREFCQRNGIPIFRRCTGGGTVLQGPGCLNFSVILRQDRAEPLQSIHGTNEYVLKHQQCALAGLIHATVERQGQTDLTIGGLKICGHAQRRKRNCLIFHGCFLLNLDFTLMEKALPMPSRQPDYRLSRSHSDFLVNLKLSPQRVQAGLTKVWEAEEVFMGFPMDEIRRLARDKYETDEWNFKF